MKISTVYSYLPRIRSKVENGGAHLQGDDCAGGLVGRVGIREWYWNVLRAGRI